MTVDFHSNFTDIQRMTGLDQLLTVARAYATAEEIDLSTASWRALGDTKKLTAIANGADIQVGRFERTMLWFSEHWPEGADWPDAVARPIASTEPAPSQAEASAP